jgi:hypothetical protein
MAKLSVTVDFGGFAGASIHEVGLLLERDLISVDDAADALILGGPGQSRDLILQHLGLRLLRARRYKAFLLAVSGLSVGREFPPSDPVKKYLLADLTGLQETVVFYWDLIPSSVVELRLRCQVRVCEHIYDYERIDVEHALVDAAIDDWREMKKLPPRMVRFWSEYGAILLRAQPPMFADDLNAQLSGYGLCLNTNPKAIWPIRTV